MSDPYSSYLAARICELRYELGALEIAQRVYVDFKKTPVPAVPAGDDSGTAEYRAAQPAVVADKFKEVGNASSVENAREGRDVGALAETLPQQNPPAVADTPNPPMQPEMVAEPRHTGEPDTDDPPPLPKFLRRREEAV